MGERDADNAVDGIDLELFAKARGVETTGADAKALSIHGFGDIGTGALGGCKAGNADAIFIDADGTDDFE